MEVVCLWEEEYSWVVVCWWAGETSCQGEEVSDVDHHCSVLEMGDTGLCYDMILCLVEDQTDVWGEC